MASWEIISQRRSRGCGRRHRAAFERYESPIELYRPWADGCVRVPADFGREFQVRLGREEARVDVSALPKQPVSFLSSCTTAVHATSRPARGGVAVGTLGFSVCCHRSAGHYFE